MSVVNTDQYTIPFVLTSAGYKINKPSMDHFFKKTQLPWIGEIDTAPYITDADLRKLENAMIEDTWAHRHKCFWDDNTAQSFAALTVSVIVGEGIGITIDGKSKAEDVINKWNDEINVKHESIEDFISTSWFDNLIDGQTLWRVFIDETDEDEEHKVDLQRVSMRNIKTESHPTRGWRRFIQRAHVPAKQINKMKFYRSETLLASDMHYVETIIPDEPNCCIYLSFFKSPPTSSVLHLMVYKRWITWFMRKFAEKYWAPFIIAYIGDPKSGMMPMNEPDKRDSLRLARDALVKIRNYGVASFLGHTRVETLDTKTAKNSNVYTDYLEYLNKEIVMGLFGSMALREAKEKSPSDIVQQGYLRFIRGKRNSYGIYLRKFYAHVLLPAFGINGVEPTDIKIDWPQLKLENIKDILQSIEIAAKTGAFKDAKEIRKILTPIWRHIDDKITDKESKEMKQLFLEINSPSRAEGDKPQQRASTTKAKPSK